MLKQLNECLIYLGDYFLIKNLFLNVRLWLNNNSWFEIECILFACVTHQKGRDVAYFSGQCRFCVKRKPKKTNVMFYKITK